MKQEKGSSRIDNELYYSKGLDRRQIKTKKAIITAFFKLMEQKNLSRITITELAGTANIDRKTFYLHYSTVQEVYNDISSSIVMVVSRMIEDYMTSDIRFEPYRLFTRVNALLEDDIDFFKEAVSSGAFSDVIEQIRTAFYKALVEEYTRRVGEISDGLRMFLVFISAGTVSMYTSWLSGESNMTADQIAHLAGDSIIHGVMGIADKVL